MRIIPILKLNNNKNNRPISKPIAQKSFKSDTYCNLPNFQYYKTISFYGNKPSEISFVKDIVKNIGSGDTPVLQKQYEDTVEINYKKDFKIEDLPFERILTKRKTDFIDEFNKNAQDLYYSHQSTNEDKIKAVKFAYSFISDKAKKYKEPETLEDYLNSLNLSVKYGHTVFADNSIINMFKEAKEYWEKEYLPILLQKENEHILFVEQAMKKLPLLNELKGFQDLSISDKFFVAKYFEINNYKVFRDDPMTKIITDHTIKNKEELLNEIRQKIVIDTEIFEEKLNQIPELILSENGIDNMSTYVIKGKNKDDETSLLNLFLVALNKKDLYGNNKNTLLAYFQTLSETDINKAIDNIRKIWFMTYIPLKLENETTYQAYKTDIHVRNNNELKKINKQLEQINIKLDKISMSLTDYISNLDSVSSKFQNPVEDSIEIQRNTGMQIEEMLSSVDKLSDEEEQKLMDAFKDDGIKYLDILLSNTKDKAVENMLKDLKTVIKEEKRPSMILARLEGYATMSVMSSLIHGNSHIAAASAAHSLNSVSGASASAGGLLGSILDPHTLAFAAVVAGLYSIYSASQTHKEFSDMYFGGKI